MPYKARASLLIDDPRLITFDEFPELADAIADAGGTLAGMEIEETAEKREYAAVDLYYSGLTEPHFRAVLTRFPALRLSGVTRCPVIPKRFFETSFGWEC